MRGQFCLGRALGPWSIWDLGPGSGIIAGETSFAPAFPGTSGRRFSPCSEHRSMTQKITVIRGDGIGPEIMDATLFVLDQLKT
ncbi:hypothetical protein FNX48_027110, partial [Streptomyces sp. IF17]|nr:hypothetical protein [Streptomyces alkaliphilus]